MAFSDDLGTVCRVSTMWVILYRPLSQCLSIAYFDSGLSFGRAQLAMWQRDRLAVILLPLHYRVVGEDSLEVRGIICERMLHIL